MGEIEYYARKREPTEEVTTSTLDHEGTSYKLTHYPADAWTPDSVADFIHDNAGDIELGKNLDLSLKIGDVLVLEDGDEMVGVCIYLPRTSRDGHHNMQLELTMISKNKRGKGLGKLLSTEATRRCLAKAAGSPLDIEAVALSRGGASIAADLQAQFGDRVRVNLSLDQLILKELDQALSVYNGTAVLCDLGNFPRNGVAAYFNNDDLKNDWRNLLFQSGAIKREALDTFGLINILGVHCSHQSMTKFPEKANRSEASFVRCSKPTIYAAESQDGEDSALLRLIDVKELFARCCYLADKELNDLPDTETKQLFAELQSDLHKAENYSTAFAFTQFNTLVSSTRGIPWSEVIVEFFTEKKRSAPDFEILQKILRDCTCEIILNNEGLLLISNVDLLIYSPEGEDLNDKIVYSEVDITN